MTTTRTPAPDPREPAVTYGYATEIADLVVGGTLTPASGLVLIRSEAGHYTHTLTVRTMTEGAPEYEIIIRPRGTR